LPHFDAQDQFYGEEGLGKPGGRAKTDNPKRGDKKGITMVLWDQVMAFEKNVV